MSENRSKSTFFEGGVSLWAQISEGRGHHPPATVGVRRLEWLLFLWYKNIRSPSFSFVTIHACDGRTGGRTKLRKQYRALHYMQSQCNKTVYMMFKPKRQSSIICAQLPPLRIGASCVQYVSTFKYLGYVFSMDNLFDDGDIRREVRCMFTRCNMLRRTFYNCSMRVKLVLFKSFCLLCFYNIALWK